MAGVRRSWTIAAVALLLWGAATVVPAQSTATGALSGKLTDLYSAPLSNATVILRNEATGDEVRTTTQHNGAYRFTGLDAGAYTLIAESPALGRGNLEGLMVSAGNEAHLQTAMRFEPFPLVQPVQMVFHDTIPAETPAVVVAFDFEAILTLPLPGRSVWESTRTQPETEVPVLAAPLAGEPIKQFNGRGDQLSPPPPQTSVAAAEAPRRPSIQQAKPLPPAATGPTALLASTGRPLNPSQEQLAALGQLWIGGSGFAAGVAAMSVLRAAMESAEPAPRRVAVAVERPEPTVAAVTITIPGEQLQALPATGRRWQDFALDTPTAAPRDADERGSANPAQPQPTVAIDGASRELAFGETGGGWRQGRGSAITEAAIREVQAIEGGTEAAGRRMSIATMKGGNALHGQGFLFDRQNTWGAQNPFTEWIKETSPATQTSTPVFSPEPYTPPDHEIAWGVGLGSHIRRNRLFWFAALDSYQRNDPGLATVKHPEVFFSQPENDEMQVLSARLGLSSSDPVSAGLAKYSAMLEDLAGLLGPARRTATQWTGFGRLDWAASDRHRFTLEGTGARWNSPGGGFTRVEEPYGNHSFGSSQASEEWLLGRWEAFITPNLLAVTEASAGRTILGARSQAPSAFEEPMEQQFWNQLPQMNVDTRYGFTIGNPSRFGSGSYPDEHLYEGQESLDWVRGSLLVKAGVELSHNNDSTSLLRNQTGTYTYANVENFVSDALAYSNFGLAGSLDPMNQHNCDQTGKVWRDAANTLHGVGYLPCYSYYSQLMGPANWWVSTSNWAGYGTAQWEPKKQLVLSAGFRWEWEQLPPAIAELHNSEFPLTQSLPSLGNNWAPRISLAWGTAESHWPVIRLGYGMYFGRLQNAVVETALTQTGSPNGDLNFFMRPTDNLNTGGAPPFPYVLAGEPLSMVKPGAVEFAPGFRNSEIHQALAGVEETLPGHVQISASAVASLGRRLPITVDTNFDPAANPGTITYAIVDGTGNGPIKAPQITVPFYANWPSATGAAGRLNPDYQQVTEIMSRANSTYEAAMLRINRYARHGLSLHARYTYAHAMDWNPNQSAQVTGSDVLDPAHFSQEYGTSDLDVRHSAGATVVWEAPWKLHDFACRVANGWMLSGIGNFHSGLPFTMRTSGSLAKEFDTRTGAAIVALGPGMNGSGGDNRVYGIGRNTYRYPQTWKADLRLARRFDLGHMRELEVMAESFNLFNHQNVTELETVGYYIEPGSLTGGLPSLNFLTGLKANTSAFGQPLNVNATNFYRERQIQFGMRVRF